MSDAYALLIAMSFIFNAVAIGYAFGRWERQQ